MITLEQAREASAQKTKLKEQLFGLQMCVVQPNWTATHLINRDRKILELKKQIKELDKIIDTFIDQNM